MDATDEFRWLFRQEYRSIVWSVHVVLQDYARAEEVTQDAFLKLLDHWVKVSKYDRPGAWVRKVAIQLAVKAAKRDGRRRQAERAAPTNALAPAGPPDLAPVDPDLMAAVRLLSPKQRAAVALHYLEDRPVGEVADLMACERATVAVHLHRARQRLAALLGEEATSVVD